MNKERICDVIRREIVKNEFKISMKSIQWF